MNEFMKWLYGKKIEREMNKSADTQEERDKMEVMTRRLMEDIENRIMER